MRLFVLVLTSSLAAAFTSTILAACNKDDDRPPPADPGSSGGVGGSAGSTTTNEGGATDAGSDGGGACHDLENASSAVDRVAVLGDPPVGLGGTVVPGAYRLTDYVVYAGISGVSGPTGLTARSRILLDVGVLDRVTEFGGNVPTSVESTRGSLTTSGTNYTVFETCPNVQAIQRTFTATPTQLILYDGLTKEALTYAKE